VKKERIDKLLVDLGLAESSTKARALVMSGVVLVNEQRIEKPSEKFLSTAKIRLKSDSSESKYVSRGGLKLEKALHEFQIRVNEYVCLDIGASTGGFTDCLLQHGARIVFTVDSGTNQLDWKLRSDDRVASRENANARYLKPEDFPEKFDLVVIDVSFISITKIFPVLDDLLKANGKVIALIKPQFEVKKDEVGKGGIVTDIEKHKRVVEEVNAAAARNNLKFCRVIDSPILGMEGNKEFLALYEKL
jgi:23S rRNA (cytidine1920-2'-O)/16S rRNA (cytidine1409-2'-O)-methyltransferase